MLLGRDLFSRRVSLDGKGVDPAFQLGRERVVDQPVAVDPRLAGELGRHHDHAEMALARAGRVPVARVHMRLVDHVEPGRPERDHQFLSDGRRDRHSGSSQVGIVTLTGFASKLRQFRSMAL